MQPFSCQHREQYISRRNYKIKVLYCIHRFTFANSTLTSKMLYSLDLFHKQNLSWLAAVYNSQTEI
jgi:hypothetical protein